MSHRYILDHLTVEIEARWFSARAVRAERRARSGAALWPPSLFSAQAQAAALIGRPVPKAAHAGGIPKAFRIGPPVNRGLGEAHLEREARRGRNAPRRVFGCFLHEWKVTAPPGGYSGQLGSHRRKYCAYHVGMYSPMSSG